MAKASAPSWSVDVDGATELINRLKKFDKEIYKILTKEMRQAADLVAGSARAKIPNNGLLNWGRWVERRTTGSTGSTGAITFVQAVSERSLSFDQGATRKGIKPKATTRGSGQNTQWRALVQQMNPAGAIYSLAGSKSSSTFSTNLNNKHGRSVWPRALTPALYEKGPEAGDAIADAIQRAMNKV